MAPPAGFVHLFFESYFVIHHVSLAGSQELFGQLWKEYSLSDSRYLTSDSFLVTMEAVTAVRPSSLAHPCPLSQIDTILTTMIMDTVRLGPPLLSNRLLHRRRASRPARPAADPVRGPSLRRRALLRDQPVRASFRWGRVLSARGVLLLVLLLLF